MHLQVKGERHPGANLSWADECCMSSWGLTYTAPSCHGGYLLYLTHGAISPSV
jgi:hypothetical protein